MKNLINAWVNFPEIQCIAMKSALFEPGSNVSDVGQPVGRQAASGELARALSTFQKNASQI